MAFTPYILERKLADLFGFDYAVMLGRARSGLVALIEILQKDHDHPIPVLLPENICPILIAAIRAGGGIAVTVPVSPLTGLSDDLAFVHAMSHCHDSGIVMPTHLYGFLGDYPETVKYARQKGWFILENDTNAAGTRMSKKSFADASLVSFGYAKPIEIGRGGAFLTNDTALALTIQKHVFRYGILNERARALEGETMLKRRAIRPRLETESEELKQICAAETSLSRFRFDVCDTEILLKKLAEFPEEVKGRLDRRDLWDNALAGLNDILQPVPCDQPVPWRLIRRIPKGRNHFAQALWHHKIDAGINYRSLWREIPAAYLSGERAAEDDWGDSVLNLWITAEYDKNRILKAADILEEAANDI